MQGHTKRRQTPLAKAVDPVAHFQAMHRDNLRACSARAGPCMRDRGQPMHSATLASASGSAPTSAAAIQMRYNTVMPSRLKQVRIVAAVASASSRRDVSCSLPSTCKHAPRTLAVRCADGGASDSKSRRATACAVARDVHTSCGTMCRATCSQDDAACDTHHNAHAPRRTQAGRHHAMHASSRAMPQGSDTRAHRASVGTRACRGAPGTRCRSC